MGIICRSDNIDDRCTEIKKKKKIEREKEKEDERIGRIWKQGETAGMRKKNKFRKRERHVVQENE